MIGQVGANNMGSLQRIALGLLLQPNIGEPVNYLLTQEVVLAEPLLDIDFVEGSGGYSEELVRDGGDELWDCAIVFKVPSQQALWHTLMSVYNRYRFVADITDMNGSRKFIGTNEEGLKLDLKYNTGRAPSEWNGDSIAFVGRFRKRPPFYEPASSGSGS